MEVGGVTVALSHVDRVMFPDAGITKGDVIAYHADVADVILPEVRRRALTIERFTKGIDAGGFMMKHAQKHYPAYIDRVTLGGKTKVTYPVCDTAAGLVYFANQGAITLHVWSSRCDAPDRPDALNFNLQSPEQRARNGSARVAHLAARRVRGDRPARVSSKPSGSKGGH